MTLFVPGSPDPWAGAVIHMTEDRVKPLNVPFEAVVRSMKRMGYGTASMLDGTWTEDKENDDE